MFSVLTQQFQFNQSPFFESKMVSEELINPVRQWKKRRMNSSSVESAHIRTRSIINKKSAATDFSLEEASDGFILKLFKELSKQQLYDAIYTEVQKIKEQNYRPSYNIVRDVYGNQLCIEDPVEHDELLQSAMSQVDLDMIGNHLSKNHFKDYNIELNHRGDELIVSSKDDSLHKEIELTDVADDILIIDCKLEKKLDLVRDERYFAVLKIGIIRDQQIKQISSTKKHSSHRHKSSSKHKKHKKHISRRSKVEKSFEIQNDFYSPVLEELEDVEIQYYNESLARNQQPTSIIEEI